MASDSPKPKATRSKPLGRPKGKRSNPNYIQISGYVTLKTYKAVKNALFKEEMEYSELIQLLLDEWLLKRKAKK
jgi:hypothetical protein